ncbi:hypothetical protein EJB05_48097 [Eragrostis curvula]|uniref:Protein argonaute N-terminal domain-containing protein n=1 Tax=Eragrostis curvula TaxID=38414 RepID=A0A5J9T0Z9_9POAL|nr:hypothetical protein EJB05_48097 [Eragrostis curvula]
MCAAAYCGCHPLRQIRCRPSAPVTALRSSTPRARASDASGPLRTPPPPLLVPATHQPAQGLISACLSPLVEALAKEVKKPLASSTAAMATTQVCATAAPKNAWEVDLVHGGAGNIEAKVMMLVKNFLSNHIFHYDVIIYPELKSRQANREALNELIKLYGNKFFGGKLLIFYGTKSLYTARALPFKSEEFAVRFADIKKKEKERAVRKYTITIQLAGRTDMYNIMQLLLGRQRDTPQGITQVLDVVLGESALLNYVSLSTDFSTTFYCWRAEVFKCWRGYYQNPHPLVTIDECTRSFFKAVRTINFVEKLLDVPDSTRPLSYGDAVKIKKTLQGIYIETCHQQDRIRRYKITGITPVPMRQLMPFIINQPVHYESLNTVLSNNAFALFDIVLPPPELMITGDQHPAFMPIYFWSGFTCYLMHRLFVLVFWDGHLHGRCYGGRFTSANIGVTADGQLKINVESENYYPDGGRADCNAMITLIHELLLIPFTHGYPVHVEFLVTLLSNHAVHLWANRNFLTFLVNYPSLLSHADKYKWYTMIDLKILQLDRDQLDILRRIFTNPIFQGWQTYISHVPAFNDTFMYRAQFDSNAQAYVSVYTPHLDQAFHFGRNFLSHPPAEITQEVAEAALSYLLDHLLAIFVLALVIDFVGPQGWKWELMGIISNSNSDKSKFN